MDQIESSNPGFIAQIKGRPTKQSYFSETKFTDRYSDLLYVHLHKIFTSNDTVQTNRYFEAYIQNIGFQIRNSHSKNGIF